MLLACFFSLAGVPPALGFASKLSVLSGLAQTSLGFTLLIFVVFTMVLSAVGYLRLVASVILVPHQLASGVNTARGTFSVISSSYSLGFSFIVFGITFGGLFFIF